MRDAFRSLRTNHCSPSKPALGSRSFADWLVGNPAPHGLERFSDERVRSLAFREQRTSKPPYIQTSRAPHSANRGRRKQPLVGKALDAKVSSPARLRTCTHGHDLPLASGRFALAPKLP